MSVTPNTNPFAYNTGGPIAGTIQIGDIAIGTDHQDYSINPGGVPWWNGPNEDLGYVITIPVPGNTQPTQIPGVFASVGFYRTKNLNDAEFIGLSEFVANKYNTPQTFSSATDASTWLFANGYWNSYNGPLVLRLDAGDPASYPGTGTIWTDTVGGKVFNLVNGPVYNGSYGGQIGFDVTLQQYANCATSLNSNLPTWSVSAWVFPDGNTPIQQSACIVTEVFPGATNTINYALGNTSDSTPFLQTGFFTNNWYDTPQNYQLNPGQWSYIVGTYDGNFVNLYVNNSLINSTPQVASPISSQGGINLMKRWDDGEFFGGFLSTVSIYSKALTAGQIADIWNTDKPRYGL